MPVSVLAHVRQQGRTLIGFTEFNEVQTDKRNAYRSKVANKAAGAGEPGEDDTQEGGDGRPAAKKARLDGAKRDGKGGDGEVDPDEIQDADQTEDDDDDAQDDENEDEDGEDEHLEADEQLEDIETGDVEDEALDNGEDSD